MLQRRHGCSVTRCSLHSREEVCGRSHDREEAAVPRPVMVTLTMARLPRLLLGLLTLAASVSGIQIISSSPHSSTVVPEGSWITAAQRVFNSVFVTSKILCHKSGETPPPLHLAICYFQFLIFHAFQMMRRVGHFFECKIINPPAGA